jgi:hypothetical protein
MADLLGGADGESERVHHQRLETSTTPPLGSGVRDLRAPTFNVKKHRRWPPWEVSELEIRERPPSTLRNIDSGGGLVSIWDLKGAL